MHRKQLPALRVLAASRNLCLPEVGPEAALLCPQLETAARQLGLQPDGPWIFVHHDLPHDASSLHRVDFCLPVSGEAAGDGPFALLALPPLHCASHDYHGPLHGLFSHGYAPLLAAIAAAGAMPGQQCREVYHRWLGPEDSGNHVELQFALA
ncbi:GyrI-like domain-containing protein [Vogesella sp. LIG4]|uniref:GyrI-like domain-containing protein n=1 Tax=Vogesella sp. LIG4 TaxID=1192162 RepID=UPI00081FF646|nr:GyrI-like domain-containing protein [Vogesella sp. LIG4]SCK28694.1 Bacterial transcription activator, effector binding domain [Vogesella sp. LIG4]